MHSPDIERIRAETPVCRNLVHLNDAGAALMPTPVYDAVRAHLDLECQIGGYEAAEAAQADIERVCADGGWYPITLDSQGARWTGPESVDLERTAHRNENWEDVIGIGPFGTLGTWPSSARARRLRNLPRRTRLSSRASSSRSSFATGTTPCCRDLETQRERRCRPGTVPWFQTHPFSAANPGPVAFVIRSTTVTATGRDDVDVARVQDRDPKTKVRRSSCRPRSCETSTNGRSTWRWFRPSNDGL
jgi:hypothetical protein